MLHGPVGELHRERPIALIKPLCSRAEDTVRVSILLEDAPNDLVGDLARSHRSPRRNSSYVIRRRPSGCTSTGTTFPSTSWARQMVTGRP